MSNLSVKRECARRESVQATLSKDSKSASLYRVMADAIRRLRYDPIHADKAAIRKACEEAFAEKAAKMLPFEAESELERCVTLLERWASWEQYHKDWNLIDSDCFSKVRFAGEEYEVRVDALVRRVDHIEAIRFYYSAPKLSYKGRSSSTLPNLSPDLLLLQTAGENLAKAKGINVEKDPVYASHFHMKSAKDTAAQFDFAFDSRPGANIVSWSFTESQKKDLEQEFANLKGNLCDDPKVCAACPYNDLCHAEFVAHKLEEEPDVPVRKINELHLTRDQQRFVNFNDGVLRVNAVAGAGKTTVIALRSLALIEEGTEPEHILMLTFTDKAKGEMKARLHSYADGAIYAGNGVQIPVDRIEVETFNSWGQKLVEQYYRELGFTNPPELVDDVVKKDILIDLLDKHRNLKLDYRNPFMSTVSAHGAVMKMVDIIDALKAGHAETEDDAARIAKDPDNAAELLEIYNDYNKELTRRNLLDYEDQLRLLLKLDEKGIFHDFSYEHVVVDEFQDSNPNQIDLIVKLVQDCESVRSLVVVGDELQSIYGFRNATPENLISLKKYFPNMEDIPLADNFRSETPIIALANHIISQTARIPTAIIGHSPQTGTKPAIIKVGSVDEELKLYTRQVAKLLKDGTSPGDIAVLCRTRSELIKFQEAFDQAGIPTILRVPKVVGDEPFVKAILSLASFLKNSGNLLDLAFYEKSLGKDPFDAKAMEDAAKEIKKKMDSLTEEEEKISLFMELIEHTREDYVGESFVDSLKKRNFHTLSELLDYCEKYQLYNTREMISSSRQEADCVSLITIHSAKGLEWNTVLLSMRKFASQTPEDRRLLYVAVTRAKQRLLISYTEKQSGYEYLLKC